MQQNCTFVPSQCNFFLCSIIDRVCCCVKMLNRVGNGGGYFRDFCGRARDALQRKKGEKKTHTADGDRIPSSVCFPHSRDLTDIQREPTHTHTLFCRHRALRCIAYFLSHLCVKIDSKKWKHETGVNWTSSLAMKTSSVSFARCFFPSLLL